MVCSVTPTHQSHTTIFRTRYFACCAHTGACSTISPNTTFSSSCSSQLSHLPSPWPSSRPSRLPSVALTSPPRINPEQAPAALFPRVSDSRHWPQMHSVIPLTSVLRELCSSFPSNHCFVLFLRLLRIPIFFRILLRAYWLLQSNILHFMPC